MNYDWHFSRLIPYAGAFAYGTLLTVVLTTLIVLLGTTIGVVLGGFLNRKGWLKSVWLLVDIGRALPPLVLLLFFYYGLSVQIVGFVVTSFWVAVVALSLNLGAFAAELVRATKEKVDPGIIDAGRALGMSESQVMWHIIMPEVVRDVAPGMSVLYIGTLKMTSLASIVNVRELTFTANTVIADIARSLEAWTLVGLIYVALVLPASYLSRKLETAASHRRL